MENHQIPPNEKRHKRQGKDTSRQTQLQTIFQYLQTHIATATMVSLATGVPQKCICRYKRDLEKRGLLWETEKKLCKKTGFRAWYLTANPNNAPEQSTNHLTNFK